MELTLPPTLSLPAAYQEPKRGLLSLILGPAGTGKSSFCAQWPNPTFIIDNRDEGILDLISERQVPLSASQVTQCDSHSGYCAALLRAVNSDYQSIICESLLGIIALSMDHCSREQHGGDRSPKSFLNFQAGPISAIDKFLDDMVSLMMMGQNRGKHVWLVGHTEQATAKNIAGSDYLAAKMAADKRATALVAARFMNVFVLADEINVEGRANQVGKVASDSTRWMFPHANPRYPSKNRMGLTCEFPFPPNAKDAYIKFCEVTSRNPRTGYRQS